jgi:hypothetical protein
MSYTPGRNTIFRDEYGLKDGWLLMLIVGIAIALIGGAIIGGLLFDKAACGQAADELGTNHHYRTMSGCYVQAADGRYIPLDNYRNVEVAK